MNATYRDIIEYLIRSWSSFPSDSDEGFRIIRGQVDSAVPLSHLLHWKLSIPVVYSFDSGTHTETLGIGTARVIEATGPEMFGEVKRRLAAIPLADGLKWFGAFSFDPTVAQSGIWQGMPHAMWFVPKLTLVRQKDAPLQFIYVDEEDVRKSDLEAAISDWLRGDAAEILVSNAAVPAHVFQHGDKADNRVEGVLHSPADWSSTIDEALRAIEAGDLRKVVLARQTEVTVTRLLPEVISFLLRQYPESHVFALHWRDRFLVGASPEQLARAENGRLEVDCLAGSTGRGETEAEDTRLADALLGSAKNLSEHGAVVEFVTERLKLAADDIRFSDHPSLKRLANVQHLHTLVSGKLRSGHSLMDVVELLHPTPAVGGVPRHAALDFIRENEHWGRGFYAGAFGFIDGAGNGLFSVALRTAGVCFPQARLFAGCGIVDGSNASEEWQETEMKLQPMRMALC